MSKIAYKAKNLRDFNKRWKELYELGYPRWETSKNWWNFNDYPVIVVDNEKPTTTHNGIDYFVDGWKSFDYHKDVILMPTWPDVLAHLEKKKKKEERVTFPNDCYVKANYEVSLFLKSLEKSVPHCSSNVHSIGFHFHDKLGLISCGHSYGRSNDYIDYAWQEISLQDVIGYFLSKRKEKEEKEKEKEKEKTVSAKFSNDSVIINGVTYKRVFV